VERCGRDCASKDLVGNAFCAFPQVRHDPQAAADHRGAARAQLDRARCRRSENPQTNRPVASREIAADHDSPSGPGATPGRASSVLSASACAGEHRPGSSAWWRRDGAGDAPRAPPGTRAAETDYRGNNDYLIARMITSSGLPPLFLDSCFMPRPMNSTSPRFHWVLALPSTVTDIASLSPSAITT
jgi:hypothetical protein